MPTIMKHYWRVVPTNHTGINDHVFRKNIDLAPIPIFGTGIPQTIDQLPSVWLSDFGLDDFVKTSVLPHGHNKLIVRFQNVIDTTFAKEQMATLNVIDLAEKIGKTVNKEVLIVKALTLNGMWEEKVLESKHRWKGEDYTSD